MSVTPPESITTRYADRQRVLETAIRRNVATDGLQEARGGGSDTESTTPAGRTADRGAMAPGGKVTTVASAAHVTRSVPPRLTIDALALP
jgi:hypothetical protein